MELDADRVTTLSGDLYCGGHWCHGCSATAELRGLRLHGSSWVPGTSVTCGIGKPGGGGRKTYPSRTSRKEWTVKARKGTVEGIGVWQALCFTRNSKVGR